MGLLGSAEDITYSRPLPNETQPLFPDRLDCWGGDHDNSTGLFDQSRVRAVLRTTEIAQAVPSTQWHAKCETVDTAVVSTEFAA